MHPPELEMQMLTVETQAEEISRTIAGLEETMNRKETLYEHEYAKRWLMKKALGQHSQEEVKHLATTDPEVFKSRMDWIDAKSQWRKATLALKQLEMVYDGRRSLLGLERVKLQQHIETVGEGG